MKLTILVIFGFIFSIDHSNLVDSKLMKRSILISNSLNRNSELNLISSNSIDQSSGHNLNSDKSIAHKLLTNSSINHQSSIYSHSIDSNFYDNHLDQLDNFNSYKNEVKKLFVNKLNTNLNVIEEDQKSLIKDNLTIDHLPVLSRDRYEHKLINKKFQSLKQCKCQIQRKQRSLRKNYIVNGQNAEPNSVPWIVSIAEKNSHFCGGSIINQWFILSAAHCIWDSKAPNLQVRVGINSLNDPSISKKTYRVERIYVHPLYNDRSDASAPGDIGILKLKTPISFIEGQIEPACLGLTNKKKYSQLIATGWGSTIPTTSGRREYPGKLSNVLKRADFVTRTTCESNRLICIKPIHRGQSICDGDSGGPLHFTSKSDKSKSITSVVGVCSFGLGKPVNGGIIKYCLGDGAYTRLSSYKNFILSKIGNTNYCPG